MDTMKLKVGVVGAGALGKFHSKFYTLSENADLVGIYDVNPGSASKVAQEFNTKVFDKVKDLAEQCDALSVAVPAHKHFETAIPLLKMKKHLLMEKPLATEVKHGEKMVKLAEKNNLVLGVGHVERYNPILAHLEKCNSKTRFIEAHRLAPFPPPRPGLYPRGTEVGVVLDLMIHDLDIILRLVGVPVEKVDAVGMPILCKDEDIAHARIQFKNGCVANVTASRISQEYQRRFRVFQTDSYVTLDYAKKTGLTFSVSDGKITSEPLPVNDHNALEVEIEDFISCASETARTGVVKNMKVTGRHGLEALKLAVKIIDKIKKYSEKYPLFKPVERK